MAQHDNNLSPLQTVIEVGVLTGERIGGELDGQAVMVLQFIGTDGIDNELLTPAQARQTVGEVLRGLIDYPAHREWALSMLNRGP